MGEPASAPPARAAYSLHIRVRAFTALGDEAVDPRADNRQRHRAELEHSIVESADVELEQVEAARFVSRLATIFQQLIFFVVGTLAYKLEITQWLAGSGLKSKTSVRLEREAWFMTARASVRCFCSIVLRGTGTGRLGGVG